MGLFLIVNADDFGLTEGVNNSILACHLAGSVTSTTLMVNMDAAQHAAAIAVKYPSLAVGLHFNLTSGRPLAPVDQVTSLINNQGEFLNRKILLQRVFSGKVSAKDIEAELLAQLNRMHVLGLQPTHFDSHQHVHAMPLVFAVLVRVAASSGLPIRMTWRWPGIIQGKPFSRKLSESVLQAMMWRCQMIKPKAVYANDGLCSVFDLSLEPSQLTQASYMRLLDCYSSGVVELMVHPACVDAALREKTAITAVSAVEDDLLRSDFLRSYTEARGGRLASYRDVV